LNQIQVVIPGKKFRNQFAVVTLASRFKDAELSTCAHKKAAAFAGCQPGRPADKTQQ